MPGDCQGTSARERPEGEKVEGEEESKVESGCHHSQDLPGCSASCQIANAGMGRRPWS